MIATTLPPTPTVVKYDRHARAWEAVNGATTRFPAGPEGRRRATLYALEHDRPDIAAETLATLDSIEAARPRLPVDVPGLTSRILKAGLLLRDGHVLPPRELSAPGSYLTEIARVKSQTEKWPDGSPVEYAITQDSPDDFLGCGCEDFTSHRAPVLPSGQRACKHVLAFLMAESLEAAEAGADF